MASKNLKNVNNSSELRELRKELKLAKSKLEEAEYEVEYAEHMVSQAQVVIEFIEKKIKKVKDVNNESLTVKTKK